jgi:glycosyltransferase involved in cell wall biosynthesis
MSEPLVSIIVPSYNRATTLPRTVESVLAQSHQSLELLIVDDGSTDGTMAVAKSLCERDPRVRILTNQRRKGAPGARNTGLGAAKGQWVVFLDSDDTLESEMISRLLALAEDDGKPQVVTCYTRFIDEESSKHLEHLDLRRFTQGNIYCSLLTGETYIPIHAAIIRSDSLRQIKGFDEACPSFQEWDLHLRLAHSCHYACLPELLVNYFQHANQMSKRKTSNCLGLLYIYRKHRDGWFRNDLRKNWKTRQVDLYRSIICSRDRRTSLLISLFKTEPRSFVWIPQSYVLHLCRRLRSKLFASSSPS